MTENTSTTFFDVKFPIPFKAVKERVWNIFVDRYTSESLYDVIKRDYDEVDDMLDLLGFLGDYGMDEVEVAEYVINAIVEGTTQTHRSH